MKFTVKMMSAVLGATLLLASLEPILISYRKLLHKYQVQSPRLTRPKPKVLLESGLMDILAL